MTGQEHGEYHDPQSRRRCEDALACARGLQNHRSMAEEARLILRDGVGRRPSTENFAEAIRARIAPLGGVNPELPPREPGCESPTFD